MPGVGELLGLTIATEIGDIARFKARGNLSCCAGKNPDPALELMYQA